MSRRPSRKEFLGLTAIGLTGALGVPRRAAATARATAPTPVDPDLVVVNAKIYTMDAAMPRAQAIAVKDGRLVAVGGTADLRGLIGKKTQLIDAKQMTIVPGFVDCHNHAGGTMLLYETAVGNPFEVEFVTIASIIEKLKAKAQKTPAGVWVEGFFHDDTKLKDKRSLTLKDLDQVSVDHPVIVRHRGGHTYFFNTKAFELAGITKNTPNPPGGTFDKDANGELTGRVTDRAGQQVMRAGKRPSYTPAEVEQRERSGFAHISKEFARYGLTSVHHQGGDLSAMQDVRAKGELRHRVSYEMSGAVLESMITNGIKTGFGDEWIKFGATSEHTVDGSFSERTMSMSTPYAGVTPEYRGNITETQDVLNAWVERVHRAGIQVNIHANGEPAIASYLTAFERAQQLAPRSDARPKITHCTKINADLVKRMKAVDAVPALFTTYAYYNTDKFPFYGEAFMKEAMAFRTLLDAGINATAGSDFQPGPFAPLMGIQGMVTRTGWDGTSWGTNQRISVSEAIKVNTLNGAYASHEESLKGTITEGKLADFVMLADDPHTVSPDKIKDIPIVRTVVGGATKYQA